MDAIKVFLHLVTLDGGCHFSSLAFLFFLFPAFEKLIILYHFSIFFTFSKARNKLGFETATSKEQTWASSFFKSNPPKKKKKTHTHRHFEVSRNNAFVNCKNETFYFLHPPKKKTRLRDREWNNHVKIFRVSQKTRILMVQFLCACYFDDIVLIRVHASMVPHQRDDTKLFVTLRHLPTSTTCL